MELVTLARFFNPAEAQLLASRLRAAEFDVVVAHEVSALSMDGYGLTVGGIRVQVPDDQEADARALLDSPENPPGKK